MKAWFKVLILAAAAVALASISISAVSDEGSDAVPDDPLELETHVYLVKEDGTYDTFTISGSNRTTVRAAVTDAVSTQGHHSLEVKANGQIKSIDGKENTEDSSWVVFIWKSPTGWNPISNTNSDCHSGASLAVAFSERVKTADGRNTYQAPDIDVEYTVHFFLRWDKWTDQLNSNRWMRAIYDQVGWESMKAGFWIYGNGFNNNDALAHAVYNEFFSQYSCNIDTTATDRVTWYVGGEQFFQYGIKSDMYGWFLDFLGWQDTKESSAGGGGYGTWTYWSQYRYDLSSGNLADPDNWTYNQLSFGLYDISVDSVFGLWLRTTSEEPTGTIALGTPDAVRMDKTDSTVASEDGRTVTRNMTVVDFYGNKTGTKTDTTVFSDSGRTETVESSDSSGNRLSSEISVSDAAGHLMSRAVTRYAYDSSGSLIRTVETATSYNRDSEGEVLSYTVVEKTTDSDGKVSATDSEVRYADGYELTISKSGSGSSISAEVQGGLSAEAAIDSLASLKTGELGSADLTLVVHGKITASDMAKASDAGISLKMVGNEGNILISGDELNSLSSAGDAEFSLARDLSQELLTEDQYSAVGGKEDTQVFVITLKCGGQEQTSFEKITLTVNITGTAPSGDLYVWRVDGDSLVEVGPAEYDPINGRATFETDHLSVYAVNVRSQSSDDDGGLPTAAVAAAAVIAIAVLAAAVLVMHRRKSSQ